MGEVYTMTIDDASSIINWHPQGDGGLGDQTADGWQPFYSGSPGGFTTRGGEAALGDSMHITAFPNATFDFEFYGTSVSLIGIANCSYEVSVDGNNTRSLKAQRGQSTILFSQDGLSEGTHTLSLTANASHANRFAFQRADVSRTITAGAQVPTPHVYQATNTSFVQYTGNWTVLHDPLIPSQQHPAPYMEVQDAPASFSFSFQGSGVAFNGSRIWGSYAYDVYLDDQGPVTYNASTMWFIGDALLYYRDGLDPTKTHTINVQPTVGVGLKFWLNTVTIFTNSSSEAGGLVSTPTASAQPAGSSSASGVPSSSGGHSKANVGAVVGGVIGGLAFLALGAGILWFFARRRRQATEIFEREQPSPFISTSTTSVTETQTRVRSPYAMRGDAKMPVLPDAPAVSTLSSSSPPSETGQTQTLSPTATSPAESNPDPNVAVDRIIHLLAERIATAHPSQQPGYAGSDVPPPEYGA
ncbi:hypothetical protein PYCCODRAFT_1398940 [Trametes coccinea BRFM310]|uniref:Transmembrane protein n=1 Tax=Trametes coccinea (strain BRFM310) TaxID=1353009 RepID=A0A1Y2I8D8_TRAC3|nr:hypothetical protein PYCCODRAFT_1398940 [Trametes coccinea BRFM310]